MDTKEAEALLTAIHRVVKIKPNFDGTYFQVRDGEFYINQRVEDEIIENLKGEAGRRVKVKLEEC